MRGSELGDNDFWLTRVQRYEMDVIVPRFAGTKLSSEDVGVAVDRGHDLR